MNLYHNLARCCAVVSRNEGSTLETLYNKAHVAKIPELAKWKMKDYFEKMIADGVIYEGKKDHYYTTPEEDQ